MSKDDELLKIEALHERDEKASLAQDRGVLASLWTADGVMLLPGERRLRGEELVQMLSSQELSPSYEVLEYQFDFEEIKILEDYAFEWGVLRGKTRDIATGTVVETEYNLMRILRKDGGEWKVHRSIWNLAN